MSNEEKKEPKEPPKEPKEPKEKVKKDSKFDVHDGVASAGASPVGVREKEMGRLPTTRRVKGKEVKDPTPIKRTKKPTYSSPSDRSDKPHSIDKAPLEEFLSLMEEWQKAANSTSSSEHEEPKRDVRSYTNACSQALIKFATKNGIIDPNALPSRVLEVAFTTSRSILDQRNRAQDLLVQSTNAFHLCGNLSQMIHKFLEVFIRFYNSLAQGDTLSDKCNPSASIGLSAGSPPSSAAPPATRDFVHESFKEVYDELEGVGWTSEDELEVYSSLPFKTEFPPVGYRGDNHEELLDSVKSNERVFTLPSLLRRFQYEYTQRTASIVLPKLDSVSSLFNKITSTHSASEDLKRMVLETSGVELGKLFDFESRGGNLFASSRAAMCFLMHAQVILDVISKMPMFGPLFENSKGTSRHTVDLLKNIPHITSFKPNKEKTATTPLLELLREKTGSLTLLDANKTLLDMHKDVEGRKPLQYHPKTDIVYTLIGMFFDAPLLGLKVELERTLLDIKLSQLTASAFFSSSLNFGPMFIHQDSAFFQEFLLKYPTTADSIFYTPIASATADEKKSKGKEKDKEDIRSSVTMNKKFSEPTSKFIAHLQNGLGGAGGVGVGVGGGGGGGTTTTTTTTTATASTSPKEKALLLANLLKLTSSPDHFLPPQSCTEPSPVDDKALNYIFKRSISTSTFDHLHATLCSISAQSRPFCFTPPATPVSILSPRQALNSTNSPHLEEIIDRYTSLLLGSNQAVPYAERSSAPYLSLDTIIPFLHRNKSAIIDSSKSKEVRVLGYEYELVRSPLVQIIFKLAALKSKQSKESNPPQVRLKSAQKVMTDSQPWISTGEDEISDVSAVIDKLYLLWDSKQDLNGNTKLNQFIMKVIATHRYENFNVREALKTNVEKAEAEVEFWLTVEKQVEAFMGFLRRYEVALNDSTPFRVLLSPTSSADLNVVDEDAQLPQEIY